MSLATLKIVVEIVFIAVCVLLNIIVLMQEGKEGGLGSIAGSSDTYWGQNKGRSMEGGLVRATKIMAAAFFILAILLNLKIFA